ncbi:hypothetical protein [Hoeflea sp.]|uniref:hypothetical protein n=1 Tax=Hoeflea sp. TaxID=1940281 RepID=UPI003A94F326
MRSDRPAHSPDMVNAELICMASGLIWAVCSPSVNHFHLRIGKRCFNASCAAGVEKECMMGVSSRATHAIEPGIGDLMVPQRNRRQHSGRVRDVEDACFEAVSAPRDVFSAGSRGDNSGSVFKTRIVHPETDGPVPRDFAPKTKTQGERLDVFAARTSTSAARGMMSARMAFAVAISALAAFLAFWAAGGHAPAPSAGEQQSSGVSAPAVQLKSPAAVVVSPDPVVTASTPVAPPKRAASGFTAPLPRPARIERAGSILMVRPAGD